MSLRRMILFAVPFLLAPVGDLVAQQPTGQFACTANVGVTPTVRSEGLTELVGDVILQCSGGTPTPKGQVVPTANVTVFLNTRVTNTTLFPNSPLTDALLLIDDPTPANQSVASYSAA